MKKMVPSLFRSILLSAVLVLLSTGARATHIAGMDLYYTWVSGNTYKVTLVAFADCAAAGPGTAYNSLPTNTPQVCVYNASTLYTTMTLALDPAASGMEVTPVCPADSLNTQCHNLSSTIPGIRKYSYTGTVTLPSASSTWRFLFLGYMAPGFQAGRASTITNVVGAGSSLIQLVDTLNNLGQYNSSPILTILPTPFMCLDAPYNYNPGAIDADGDSLAYELVDAGNSPGTSCTIGGTVTYVTTYPYSGTNPLHSLPGTFVFDPMTGQVGYTPDIIQRSLIVYNIREFRHGVLVGTSQREMTFKVLPCSGTAPTGGIVSATNGTVDDATHFHICDSTGPFSMTLTATSADPTLNIKVSNTGVPAGCTFTVTGDSTATPTATISWSSAGVTPGFYTFYVIFTDDACPLSHQSTQAFVIAILPKPSVAYTVITPASCTGNAIVSITPSGLGNPWTVNILDPTGGLITSYPGVSGTFLDTLSPGYDSVVVYSSLSTFCNTRELLFVDTAPFVVPVGAFTSPTFCGNNDGTITISGLNPLELDTVRYDMNGVPAPPQAIFSSGAGTITLTGLCAATYDNLSITYGTCHSSSIGPFVLQNPTFPISYAEKTDPTICGFNDGIIKIHGLHPGQVDTLKYTLNGVPQTPIVSYVGIDSTITIPNLLAGSYANFIANTQGACPGLITGCVSAAVTPAPLIAPPINDTFTYAISQACHGDTVNFTNLSTPPAGLTYNWYFGDGGIDTAKNPRHIYPTSLTPANYTVKLIITNGYCVDSNLQTISLHENLAVAFTSVPDTFICQGSTITFTNATTGWGTTYAWSFGDGGTSAAQDASNLFVNMGAYAVTLIGTDGRGCKDTFTKTVFVDSSAKISMTESDSVICKGGQVTFQGVYTDIGLTATHWTFGDGSGYDNTNPIPHSFEAIGDLTVTLTVTYRSCPTATASHNVRVYPNPDIYLGPDTAICPGGDLIQLYDRLNSGNTAASWLWNTGEVTPLILATKPGYYSATVTIFGCIATDTVWVANDCYVSYPNIFTPNGDGLNDYFFPRNLLTRGLIDFKMDIYNRWGQLIYQTKNIEGQGWDGTFNNEHQPEGVYIYQITATFKDGQKESKTGNLTLIR